MTSDFDAWVGRSRRRTALLDPWSAQALHATLDLEESAAPTQTLPPLWHWLYFLETAPRRLIDADGHPKRGDFLPPIPHPRRMFAGARTTMHGPLRLSRPAELTETVASIELKSGASGTMFLVTVHFDYHQDGELRVEEQRDYVYLPALLASIPEARPSRPLPEPDRELPPAPWARDVPIDEVLLFRFSALTFNSHRIHYDRPYASDEERYPRLVVQAPLTAILLAWLGGSGSRRPLASFAFRAVSALFCPDSLRLRGGSVGDNQAALTAYTPRGKPAVQATMTLG